MATAKESWSGLVCEETGYWTRTIARNPAAFQGRLDRETPTNPLLKGLVDLLPASEVSILDVGSGPAPVVLGRYSKPVEFVACDPLAEEYLAALAKYNVTSPVTLIAADGEKLPDHFEDERFDITHIQNALDHSYDPVTIVLNMLRLTRPGGLVVIHSQVDEGYHQQWHGLHQWNIRPDAGGFSIGKQDGSSVAMGPLVDDQIEMMLVGSYAFIIEAPEPRSKMDVVLVKKPATPEFLAGVERHFRAVQLELGVRQHVELDRALRELRQTRRRLRLIEGSGTYKLGRTLVDAARSPARIPALPRDLYRLVRPRKSPENR